MQLKQTSIQVQKQILAPSMQQSIAVLILPLTELSLAVEQELQENPLLEIDEEKNLLADAEMIKTLDRHIEHTSPRQQEETNSSEEDSGDEKPITKELTLEDALIQQLNWEIPNPLENKIGELIIGNIDEDGYLKVSLEEIAQAAGVTDLALVEKVLSIIHTFEPIGIASRNLKECLRIQIKARYNGTSDIPCQIIEHFLPELGLKKYPKIARKLGISPEEVKTLAHMITTLDPKPARNFRPLGPNLYVKADITIKNHPDIGFQVVANREGIPHLRINPFYKNMLSQKNLTLEEKNFIREKLKNAIYFMKSIEQRGSTLQEIAKFILEKQKDFFEGSQFSIMPMTLRDVAEAINRNESTVSRAIHNKYMDTPQGLLPFKFFFSQAICHEQSEGISSRGMKEEIKELVDNEDKQNPLSDQEIQAYFENKGMKVARRTIAKYRQALKISPSHLRRES